MRRTYQHEMTTFISRVLQSSVEVRPKIGLATWHEISRTMTRTSTNLFVLRLAYLLIAFTSSYSLSPSVHSPFAGLGLAHVFLGVFHRFSSRKKI